MPADNVRIDGKITAMTTFASRVFYAIEDYLFYSKTVEGVNDIAYCMQMNDPTNPDSPDVLATDGGTIRVAGAGNIRSLVPFRDGVLMIGSKGAWHVKSTSGFSAIDFSVNRLSTYGTSQPRSAVAVSDVVLYMNESGIVAVGYSDFDVPQVEMITDNTIRSYLVEEFYADTPDDHIVSAYNSRKGEVRWLNTYNRKCLVYSTDTNAFYPQEFLEDSEGRLPLGINADNLKDLGFSYLHGKLTPIGEPPTGLNLQVYDFRLLDDTTFTDYEENNPYPAYMVAGPESLGQWALGKNITSVSLAFKRTETQITDWVAEPEYDRPSSCLLSSQWDTSSYSGYSSTPRQVYFLNRRRWIPQDTNYPLNITDQGDDIVYFEDKVRGNGKLVNFKFEAEDFKDMQLLGFSVDYSMKGRQR